MTQRSNQEIVAELRLYNKDKGWPLAHEAADRIEALQKEVEDLKRSRNDVGWALDVALKASEENCSYTYY